MTIDIDEKNNRHEALDDVQIPAWVGRLLRFSYLGIGLFLLVSSLTLLGCSSAGASDAIGWQDATEIISEERAREIASENSSYLSESEMNSLIDLMQAASLGESLVMINFNSPLLTGRLGTLHVIYDSEGSRIFNRYLNRRIPEGVPVVQLSARTSSGYPCLIVNDLNQPVNPTDLGIVQTTLCYDGVEWNKANTQVVSVSSFQ